MRLCILFGGPSDERAISLNSARSVSDHLSALEDLELSVVFVTADYNFYPLPKTWLYSNTTEDFIYKIDPFLLISQDVFIPSLNTFDLVFPVIHGEYGEDGTLFSLLEQHQIPYIGSSSEAARVAFYKDKALEQLDKLNLAPGPFISLDLKSHFLDNLRTWLNNYVFSKYILKPVDGGSSLGIHIFSSIDEAKQILTQYSASRIKRVVVEPFYDQAKEFSITVLQVDGVPVPFAPVSITYPQGEFFDYRKKYLPSLSSSWQAPATFSDEVNQKIRQEAKRVFSHFSFRHWVRLDGWVFDNDRVAFSDINITSGLEQNSLIFIQAAACGLDHVAFMHLLLNQALKSFDKPPLLTNQHSKKQTREKIRVVFGGNSAERQVSLLSGTNVWMKLLSSSIYEPIPYFLTPSLELYQLPYKYFLYHTVEEILHAIEQTNHRTCYEIPEIAHWQKQDLFAFKKDSVNSFLQNAADLNEYVFLALHGGEGEDGTWQEWLEAYEIPFNGSMAQSSKTCMNKKLTAESVHAIDHPMIDALPKFCFSINDWSQNKQLLITKIQDFLIKYPELIIKPQSDGCSNGILKVTSLIEIEKYIHFILNKKTSIPPKTFENQFNHIQLPVNASDWMLEPFLSTDKVQFYDDHIELDYKTGWIELTVGVIESEGDYTSLEPSFTASSGAVLSLEEKFQSGTGTNLTPVPFLTAEQRALIKSYIELTAKCLKIQDYARLDVFYHRIDDKMIIIEANTLPALTPSTVIYHQALAFNNALNPKAFLEMIITNSKKSKEDFYLKNRQLINLDMIDDLVSY